MTDMELLNEIADGNVQSPSGDELYLRLVALWEDGLVDCDCSGKWELSDKGKKKLEDNK